MHDFLHHLVEGQNVATVRGQPVVRNDVWKGVQPRLAIALQLNHSPRQGLSAAIADGELRRKAGEIGFGAGFEPLPGDAVVNGEGHVGLHVQTGTW